MRKIIGWVLLALGTFLVVVGLMAALWAPGQVKRTPLDTDSVTRLAGNADKLNPATGEVEAIDVQATSITKADSELSDDDVVVFVNSTCLVINDEGDVPDCVDATTRTSAWSRRRPTCSPPTAATRWRSTARPTSRRAPRRRRASSTSGPSTPRRRPTPTGTASSASRGRDVRRHRDDRRARDLPLPRPGRGRRRPRSSSGVEGVYSQDKYIWIDPVTGSDHQPDAARAPRARGRLDHPRPAARLHRRPGLGQRRGRRGRTAACSVC